VLILNVPGMLIDLRKQLLADLEQAEAAAGSAGWREWLLEMRNPFVHRGRRTKFLGRRQR
jgi:hypothetical protein